MTLGDGDGLVHGLVVSLRETAVADEVVKEGEMSGHLPSAQVHASSRGWVFMVHPEPNRVIGSEAAFLDGALGPIQIHKRANVEPSPGLAWGDIRDRGKILLGNGGLSKRSLDNPPRSPFFVVLPSLHNDDFAGACVKTRRHLRVVVEIPFEVAVHFGFDVFFGHVSFLCWTMMS